MRARTSAIRLLAGVILLVPLCLTPAFGQFKVIHNFGSNSNDGAQPNAGVTLDNQGNLYGATASGGARDLGTVYELTNSGGTWDFSSIHDFAFGNGAIPGSGVVLDGSGNLYGVVQCGSDCDFGGLYKVTLASDLYTELHVFMGGGDGTGASTVNVGSDGRLYGNGMGGSYGAGLVFTFPTRLHAINEFVSVLYDFRGGADGNEPSGPLVFDARDNIYGTTSAGGNNFGTVYKLTPNGSIGWTHAVLYSFQHEPDGNYPLQGVIFDAAGNLYGTTNAGGSGGGDGCPAGCGTVFKLTHNPNGTWSESILYTFKGNMDGAFPTAVAFDSAGYLYGTTNQGGPANMGTVFELTPSANGPWTETILHNFSGGSDGGNPTAGVTLDSAGNLYGTASAGGLNGAGVVFEISGLN
jgi:uncharacterized repeat protein (TIGR03803 family)